MGCDEGHITSPSQQNLQFVSLFGLFPLLPFPSPPSKASAVLPPSSSLQSLVPSSSLPPSLWCHGSLAPGGEGRREEGMLGRRDGRREGGEVGGRGCVGCCHLFPCSYHHSADEQSTDTLLPVLVGSSWLLMLMRRAGKSYIFWEEIFSVSPESTSSVVFRCVCVCVSVVPFTQWDPNQWQQQAS